MWQYEKTKVKDDICSLVTKLNNCSSAPLSVLYRRNANDPIADTLSNLIYFDIQ